MLSDVNVFMLKCFFVGGIVLFFLFAWWASREPGPLDKISDEELRRIEREAAGCEDEEESWDL